MTKVLSENADERRMFDDGVRAVSDGNPLRAVAAALEIWHRMAPRGSYREMLAIYANEIMRAEQRLRELEVELTQRTRERDGEREAREKIERAYREKDAAMGVLFERLNKAGVDCSDLFS